MKKITKVLLAWYGIQIVGATVGVLVAYAMTNEKEDSTTWADFSFF